MSIKPLSNTPNGALYKPAYVGPSPCTHYESTYTPGLPYFFMHAIYNIFSLSVAERSDDLLTSLRSYAFFIW